MNYVVLRNIIGSCLGLFSANTCFQRFGLKKERCSFFKYVFRGSVLVRVGNRFFIFIISQSINQLTFSGF